MIDLFKQPSYLREGLAVYEALRRLGFQPDEIRPVFAVDKDGFFAIALVHPDFPNGGAITPETARFVVLVGVQHVLLDEMRELWPKVAVAWNEAPDDVTRRIWQESEVANNPEKLIAPIVAKGIRLPCVEN